MRTQVAIIGAGPAGLLLSHLLHLQGIESVVLEVRSRAAIEATIRAGILEQGTMDVLDEAGVGARMHSEGSIHHGIELAFEGERHRIDLTALTGRSINAYAQHEVIKDLVAARLAAGGQLLFEVSAVSVHNIDSRRPSVNFIHCDRTVSLDADFIVGADGSQSACRMAMPAALRREYEQIYPFGWFGVLVEAPPSSDELIYAHHSRGFALISTRSATVQRMYFQCDPKDNVAHWSDDRIWAELQERVGSSDGMRLKEGRIFQKHIIGMRSFVSTPMQQGRMFLAGDAAHIVPPTGAKGLNLAVSDVRILSQALEAFYSKHDDTLLDAYSATALKRIWRAEHFSWSMTSLLHSFADATPFQRQLQLSELRYTVSSTAAATALAENYVGLPFDQG